MDADIPLGLCQCGCGEKTTVAPVNDKSKGWARGVPVKYVKGHHLRHFGAGPHSQNWKGGLQKSSQGYVMQWTPDGRQYQHILVAEKALGRKLAFLSTGHPDNEVVHHINGIRDDNRPENLLICTHAYHRALHARLELSDEWPEFPKITRNTKEKARERLQGQGLQLG